MACCEPTERWLRTELRTTLVLRSSPVGPGFSAAPAAHGRRDRASQTLSALFIFAARASPTVAGPLFARFEPGLGRVCTAPKFPMAMDAKFRAARLFAGWRWRRGQVSDLKSVEKGASSTLGEREITRTRLFSRLPLIARNSQHLIWQRRHRSPLTADGYACARRGRGLATTAGPAVTAAYFAAAAFAAAAAARCDPDARRAVRHAGTAALPLR